MPYPRRALPRRRRALSGYVTSSLPGANPLARGPNPLLVQAPTSQNPLDYASPEAAVAAGLSPAQVTAAWSGQINQFSTVNQAINAGVPPTAVTQLWQGGAVPEPWWKKNIVLVGALAGAAALLLFGSKREAA
jgi:hypothetical protein